VASVVTVSYWLRSVGFGFELKTSILVSVRFSDPERASSATRAAHDPARLRTAQFRAVQYRAERFSSAGRRRR